MARPREHKFQYEMFIVGGQIQSSPSTGGRKSAKLNAVGIRERVRRPASVANASWPPGVGQARGGGGFFVFGGKSFFFFFRRFSPTRFAPGLGLERAGLGVELREVKPPASRRAWACHRRHGCRGWRAQASSGRRVWVIEESLE